MSPTQFACSVGLLVVLTSGCSQGPAGLSEARSGAIRDSVQTMLDDYRERSAAREWDAVVRFYANDAGFQWVENGVVRYRSAEEIRQALAALPPDVRIETTYNDTDITPVAPGLATVLSRFETRFADSTSAGFGFQGLITATLVHREDGWRFLVGHTSSLQHRAP